jgi:hypothetical protein
MATSADLRDFLRDRFGSARLDITTLLSMQPRNVDDINAKLRRAGITPDAADMATAEWQRILAHS